MRHLKTFEHYDDEDRLPEVGEYVILNPKEYGEIVNNVIGKIVHMIFGSDWSIYYYVDYGQNRQNINGKSYDVMFDLSRDQSRTYMNDYILAWSKDKDKLEMILQTNKYNL